MSATTTVNNTNTSRMDIDDVNLFQAARRNGRRNAFGDLAEQFHQANASITSAELDQMTPNFQSMSIKQ